MVGKLLTSFTVGDMVSGPSVEVGFGAARLVLLVGKASVSNIMVPLGFAVLPKALAMARLSVVASPLTILPLPPSRSRPLAPYCPISWHLTADPPLRLAPYCSPPAGTLLPVLLTGWHPTARLPGWHPPSARWLRSPSSPLRLFDPSSVMPSRGIALPPWLVTNALDRCNDLRDRTSGF